MNLLKKISVKGVIGNIKKMVASGDVACGTAIMRVIGIANGTKEGVSDNGDWVALKGQFKATNLLTGEQFGSGVCFMPDVATDMVSGMLTEDVKSVEFGFDLIVKHDESSATGYTYVAKPLVEAGQDDPLARLESNIFAKLDAPKKKVTTK